jgi:hypothetical protein
MKLAAAGLAPVVVPVPLEVILEPDEHELRKSVQKHKARQQQQRTTCFEGQFRMCGSLALYER